MNELDLYVMNVMLHHSIELVTSKNIKHLHIQELNIHVINVMILSLKQVT